MRCRHDLFKMFRAAEFLPKFKTHLLGEMRQYINLLITFFELIDDFFQDLCFRCKEKFCCTNNLYSNLCIFFYFIFIPFIILALISLSIPVVTKIRGLIAGRPPPSPPCFASSFVIINGINLFLLRRLASNCAHQCCQALPS